MVWFCSSRNVLGHFSEFEKYSLPEDWIHVSSFALPGLAPVTESRCLFEDEMENIELLPNLSPVTIPQPSGNTLSYLTSNVKRVRFYCNREWNICAA